MHSPGVHEEHGRESNKNVEGHTAALLHASRAFKEERDGLLAFLEAMHERLLEQVASQLLTGKSLDSVRCLEITNETTVPQPLTPNPVELMEGRAKTIDS